jgi:TolB-like protein
MAENTKHHPIRIDLNQFKLHIDLKKKIELTLHFNSPSRRFYLSLIAFVINEMKRLRKITSIPLEGHYDLLALLNKTIGEAAGSSEKEHLLPRIYRKWKDILPNLEEAHLFKVLGKKKEYDEGTSRTYSFTEDEKDHWANLFEYIGSEENVRLKFAIDKIGAGLEDVVILYEESLNGDAWEKFISNLKGKIENAPEIQVTESPSGKPEALSVSPPREHRTPWQIRHRWIAFAAMIAVIAGAATLAIRKLYLKPVPVKIASLERMTFPLPDKPSIAVLPFVNMSKDPEQEFFSDGLTEEIITTLSRSPNLSVTARTSAFAYKGKPIRVDQVAVELRVRYVLEGSVRRAGDQIRISAQLIDAKTDHHLWVERYDGTMKDVFAIQDEIASRIMKTLQMKLGVGSSPSKTRGGSKNPEAYLKSVEATEQINRFTRDGITRGRELFEEVIALDPDFSRGYSGLALSYGMGVMFGMSKSPKESMAQAIGLAEKAISLNEKDAINHAALAYLLARPNRHDESIVWAERALALDANSFSVLNFSGLAFMYSCKSREAISALVKADQLNPTFRLSPLHLSWAYRFAGRYEEAFRQAQKMVDRSPNYLLAQLALTATCSLSGREAEARAATTEVLRITPEFSVERYRNDLYSLFKDKSQIDLTINALRKAGLK